jgi:hypothetical protein
MELKITLDAMTQKDEAVTLHAAIISTRSYPVATHVNHDRTQ